MSYWVTISSLLVRYSGTSSLSGCGAITTPAAWTPALRAIPSRRRATSSTSPTRGSFWLAWANPGSMRMASASEMFRTLGTILVMRSTSAKLMSSTRPTSLMAARAPSVPMVMICATCSRPYFSVT